MDMRVPPLILSKTQASWSAGCHAPLDKMPFDVAAAVQQCESSRRTHVVTLIDKVFSPVVLKKKHIVAHSLLG